MSIAGFFKSIFGGGKSEASEAKEAAPAAPEAGSKSEPEYFSEPVAISSEPEGTLEVIPVTIQEGVPSSDGEDVADVSDEDEFLDDELSEVPHFETLEVFGGIGGYVGPVLSKDRVSVQGTRRAGSIGKTRNTPPSRGERSGAPGARESRGGAPTPRRERGGAPVSER